MTASAIQIYGSTMDRSISQSEIDAISKADSLNDVSSIWGKIVDWFCGTNKEEAKRLLFNMSHSTDADEVLHCFNKLRDMAADSYKEYFQYTLSDDYVTIYIMDPSKEHIKSNALNNIYYNILSTAGACHDQVVDDDGLITKEAVRAVNAAVQHLEPQWTLPPFTKCSYTTEMQSNGAMLVHVAFEGLESRDNETIIATFVNGHTHAHCVSVVTQR